MTVNIEALISNLGSSYKDLVQKGIITYKSDLKGAAGDPVLLLSMAKEGVFLAFMREGRILKEVTLSIQRQDSVGWIFPNELPSPLQPVMSRTWIHHIFGDPEGAVPPRIIMKRAFGWVEKYPLEGFHTAITMQINYDPDEIVKDIAYILTSELRW